MQKLAYLLLAMAIAGIVVTFLYMPKPSERDRAQVLVSAERIALTLQPQGTIAQCSDKNVTGLSFNATVSAPGAVGVFTTTPAGRDYLTSLTDLMPLADTNNTNAMPFPPMSCWNPNNTVDNTTLFQACNARMPADFTFPSQPMCVVFKSDREPAMSVTLDVDWVMDASSAGRENATVGAAGRVTAPATVAVAVAVATSAWAAGACFSLRL